MKGIYEYFLDYGRSGELSGIFIADSEDVAKIVGKEIYFGEILGKHSCVEACIEEGDIVLKTNDQDFIEQFEDIMGVGFESGTNPLSYYYYYEHAEADEEDEGDEE